MTVSTEIALPRNLPKRMTQTPQYLAVQIQIEQKIQRKFVTQDTMEYEFSEVKVCFGGVLSGNCHMNRKKNTGMCVTHVHMCRMSCSDAAMTHSRV